MSCQINTSMDVSTMNMPNLERIGHIFKFRSSLPLGLFPAKILTTEENLPENRVRRGWG